MVAISPGLLTDLRSLDFGCAGETGLSLAGSSISSETIGAWLIAMYDGSDDSSALWQLRNHHQTAGRASAMHFKFSIGQDAFQTRLTLYFGASMTDASELGLFVSAFVDCLLSCSEETGLPVRGDMFVDGDVGVFVLPQIQAALSHAEGVISARYRRRG